MYLRMNLLFFLFGRANRRSNSVRIRLSITASSFPSRRTSVIHLGLKTGKGDKYCNKKSTMNK